MERGKYIVLDGADGTGKSTQVRHVVSKLREQGVQAEAVREPGFTEVGTEIRQLILNSPFQLDLKTELLLLNADRAETALVVRNMLDQGTWCISDRSWLSTIVYQCIARGVDHQFPMQVCLYAMGGLKADLTLVLNVDANTANQRRGDRGVHDNIEARGDSFHQKVREGFLQVATEFGARIIEGAADVDTVTTRIMQHLEPLMEVE